MKDWRGRYTGDVMRALSEPTKELRVKAFAEAMKNRVEGYARDMIVANDTCLMHMLRGGMTICIELMDGANSALETAEGEANAGAEEGNPI